MSKLFAIVGSTFSEHRIIGVGERLFRMDDPVLSLFEIVTGEIALERVAPHGARLVLQRARRGDVVAEASLFSESYHCDAIAIVRTEVRSIVISAIKDNLSRNPDALWSLTRELAYQVQRARLRAEMLSMKRLAHRLDAWLMMHDGRLPPKGEWLPLAAELSVTPEALYRELSKRKSALKHPEG